MPIVMRFPNLISLQGVELTDESRKPLREERDERSVMVDLASGKKKKFVKGVRRRWSIDWDNVSASSSTTIDGKGGRDEIRGIAESAGSMTFKIKDGRNPEEEYIVFIETYEEELLMRREFEDGFRYKVTLTLVEQG